MEFLDMFNFKALKHSFKSDFKYNNVGYDIYDWCHNFTSVDRST